MTRNRLRDYGDAIDTPTHGYCCQLRAAAEADLEVAWETREVARALTQAANRKMAEAKEWNSGANRAALASVCALSAAIVVFVSGVSVWSAAWGAWVTVFSAVELWLHWG